MKHFYLVLIAMLPTLALAETSYKTVYSDGKGQVIFVAADGSITMNDFNNAAVKDVTSKDGIISGHLQSCTDGGFDGMATPNIPIWSLGYPISYGHYDKGGCGPLMQFSLDTKTGVFHEQKKNMLGIWQDYFHTSMKPMTSADYNYFVNNQLVYQIVSGDSSCLRKGPNGKVGQLITTQLNDVDIHLIPADLNNFSVSFETIDGRKIAVDPHQNWDANYPVVSLESVPFVGAGKAKEYCNRDNFEDLIEQMKNRNAVSSTAREKSFPSEAIGSSAAVIKKDSRAAN